MVVRFTTQSRSIKEKINRICFGTALLPHSRLTFGYYTIYNIFYTQTEDDLDNFFKFYFSLLLLLLPSSSSKEIKVLHIFCENKTTSKC